MEIGYHEIPIALASLDALLLLEPITRVRVNPMKPLAASMDELLLTKGKRDE